MWAYVIAGLMFTLAFGAIVVGATHGIHVHSGKTKGITDIAGGIWPWRSASRSSPGGSTEAVRTTHRGRRSDEGGARSPPHDPDGGARRARDHIPGMFYLVALNVIVAHNAAVAKAVALVTYNVVWFALPLAALGRLHRPPGKAPGLVGTVEQWTRDHARGILLTVAFGAGTALIIRGILTI